MMLRQLAAMLLLSVGAVGVAAASDLGVITGVEKGTYHQFGQDLKKLVKPGGINLTVHPSNGSVDNVFAVSQGRGIQLGIVQSDVLSFVADQTSNPALSRIARRVRLVFPLFDEEVHVLGRRELTDFDQLANKRVAIGREGSGAHLTARWLFKLSGIAPAELVPLDASDALAQLKAGRIDAMIYVAGQPLALLRQQVKAEDALALIPITNKSIVETYALAEIPADAYDWQTTAVSTVAVKAVLITVESSGPECEAVGRFAQQVATGFDWLTRHGHSKWKRVELETPLKGWEQYECVRKYVGTRPADAEGENPAASAGERNPIADAIKDALDRR